LLILTTSSQNHSFANDAGFQYTIYPNLLPINDLIKKANYSMDGYFPFITKYPDRGLQPASSCARRQPPW